MKNPFEGMFRRRTEESKFKLFEKKKVLEAIEIYEKIIKIIQDYSFDKWQNELDKQKLDGGNVPEYSRTRLKRLIVCTKEYAKKLIAKEKHESNFASVLREFSEYDSGIRNLVIGAAADTNEYDNNTNADLLFASMVPERFDFILIKICYSGLAETNMSSYMQSLGDYLDEIVNSVKKFFADKNNEVSNKVSRLVIKKLSDATNALLKAYRHALENNVHGAVDQLNALVFLLPAHHYQHIDRYMEMINLRWRPKNK